MRGRSKLGRGRRLHAQHAVRCVELLRNHKVEQLRAVADGLALLLAALHLEDPDFFAEGLLFDDARHRGTRDVRRSGQDVATLFAHEEHAVKRKFRARLEIQVINDTLGGIPIAVTYHPLCDSVVVFDRRVGDEVLEFGVSGLLFNSNQLLFDRRAEAAGERS